jgi:hypothetical protein
MGKDLIKSLSALVPEREQVNIMAAAAKILLNFQ